MLELLVAIDWLRTIELGQPSLRALDHRRRLQLRLAETEDGSCLLYARSLGLVLNWTREVDDQLVGRSADIGLWILDG
jgi:hypothetical protein